MIPLAFGVAILGLHARLTRLEFDGTLLLLATFGTAVHTTLNTRNPLSSGQDCSRQERGGGLSVSVVIV